MPVVRNRHRPNTALSDHIEKLLEAANSASQTVAALHVAFMAFAAYFGVIIWGTTHEDLLRNSPIKLPILDVELPLTSFYGCVPWLLVLLHFNLLIQLELLSRKLWNLDRDLPNTSPGQQVRDQLFIFPFTHFIAGRSTFPVRGLLSLVVSLTVIVLPLFILMAAQIRFLPFHDEIITWSQRVAVWTNVLILLVLWPVIASPNDKGRESWKNLAFLLFGYWFVFLRYWIIIIWNRLVRLICHYLPRLRWGQIISRPIPHAQSKGMFFLMLSVLVILPLSVIATIPGSITVDTYYHPPKKVTEHVQSPNSEGLSFYSSIIASSSIQAQVKHIQDSVFIGNNLQLEGAHIQDSIFIDNYYQIEDTPPNYFENWLITLAPKTWLSVLNGAPISENPLTCTPLRRR